MGHGPEKSDSKMLNGFLNAFNSAKKTKSLCSFRQARTAADVLLLQQIPQHVVKSGAQI